MGTCQVGTVLPTQCTSKAPLEIDLNASSARTLKGPRRFVRRVAHRANSPQWQFLRGFLKNPVMVGSVIPSSKVLIDKMLSKVRWDEVKLFVEYGPASAPSPAGARLAAGRRQAYRHRHQSRLHRLSEEGHRRRAADRGRGSAADVQKIIEAHGFGHADYVLSGLPFSTCRQASAMRSARHGQGDPRGGAFLVYQFSPKVRDFIAPISSGSTAASNGSTCPPRPVLGWREPTQRRIVYSRRS
jgi:phospholipid N-methyltransferase